MLIVSSDSQRVVLPGKAGPRAKREVAARPAEPPDDTPGRLLDLISKERSLGYSETDAGRYVFQ
jgi:hypothetical protein